MKSFSHTKKLPIFFNFFFSPRVPFPKHRKSLPIFLQTQEKKFPSPQRILVLYPGWEEESKKKKKNKTRPLIRTAGYVRTYVRRVRAYIRTKGTYVRTYEGYVRTYVDTYSHNRQMFSFQQRIDCFSRRTREMRQKKRVNRERKNPKGNEKTRRGWLKESTKSKLGRYFDVQKGKKVWWEKIILRCRSRFFPVEKSTRSRSREKDSAQRRKGVPLKVSRVPTISTVMIPSMIIPNSPYSRGDAWRTKKVKAWIGEWLPMIRNPIQINIQSWYNTKSRQSQSIEFPPCSLWRHLSSPKTKIHAKKRTNRFKVQWDTDTPIIPWNIDGKVEVFHDVTSDATCPMKFPSISGVQNDDDDEIREIQWDTPTNKQETTKYERKNRWGNTKRVKKRSDAKIDVFDLPRGFPFSHVGPIIETGAGGQTLGVLEETRRRMGQPLGGGRLLQQISRAIASGATCGPPTAADHHVGCLV